MKVRIFGTLFVLAILIVVYVITYDDNSAGASKNTQQVDPNAGALQGLNIN